MNDHDTRSRLLYLLVCLERESKGRGTTVQVRTAVLDAAGLLASIAWSGLCFDCWDWCILVCFVEVAVFLFLVSAFREEEREGSRPHGGEGRGEERRKNILGGGTRCRETCFSRDNQDVVTSFSRGGVNVCRFPPWLRKCCVLSFVTAFYCVRCPIVVCPKGRAVSAPDQ